MVKGLDSPQRKIRQFPAAGVVTTQPLSEERRQLSIMFIDIVGSTALSERLDPEDFFSILREYYHICNESIMSFGGGVVRRFGDGVLALFGMPQAHENDPERAVHASLSILEAFRERNFPVGDTETVRLDIRIAVNTGLVVVGQLGDPTSTEPISIFGQPAHLASRLQDLALPNTVVIGPTTHELVRGVFLCKSLGEHVLKGIKNPIAAWQVESFAENESRFAKRDAPSLTPMVGRSSELATLQELWHESSRGAGKVAIVTGEPGIGKSRLLQALRTSISLRHETIGFQCSPLHLNTPLSPVVAQTKRAAGLTAKDSPQQAIRKLRDLFQDRIAEVDAALPFYAALLSIPAHDEFLPADLGSTRGREQALATFIDVVLKMSQHKPVLVLAEDVHWIDPTSIELLKKMVAEVSAYRVFVVITHRSDYKADWLRGARAVHLPLGRLEVEECRQMVTMLTGAAALPSAALNQIVDRTDGVPLFVEEFTRAVLDSGLFRQVGNRLVLAGALPDPLVPTTIQDSLMERLDRLGRAKRIAQEASVLGRKFSFIELGHLTGRGHEELISSLRQLEDAGLLRRQGPLPEATFVFKHAMIQEAAYASLMKEDRIQLHARAASWCASCRQSGQNCDSGDLGILGHHYSRAGMIVEAVDALLGAGKAALRRSASKEAVAHLRQGLELVRKLPSENDRVIVEIELQSALAMALIARQGWSGPQVEQAYVRALTLCRDRGTMRQHSIALWGVTISTLVGTQFDKALQYAQEFVAFARECDNSEVELMAHTASLIANFYAGHLLEALASVDVINARYSATLHGDLVEIYQHDPKIMATVYGGHCDWLLGRPARARARCEEARQHARGLGHPFMLVFALLLGGSDHLYERDLSRQIALVDEGLKLAKEHGFAACEIFGPLWAVEAMTARSPGRNTVEGLDGLVEVMLRSNNYLTVPFYQIGVARAFARVGEVTRARALCSEGHALMLRTGELWFEPEMDCITAELSCLEPNPDFDSAATLFRQALASAHRLQAPGWELRVALSMANHLGQRGWHAEAYAAIRQARSKFASPETSTDLRAAALFLETETLC